MKVLVLASDAKERDLIQSTLEKGRHEVASAATVAEALRLVELSRPRLTILDEDIPAEQRAAFVAGVRAFGPPPVYLLSISSAAQNPQDTDDAVRKPFTASDLMARVLVAQRFMMLGDSLSEARDQMEALALYDPLTGLMNRNAFFRTAQGELERARRSASALSIISLDVDNFNPLIDAYGMPAANEALRVVAATIRERSRPYDCIGRWGGDEFMVALPGVIGDDAEKIAVRIIKGAAAAGLVYEGHALSISMSAGIASILTIHASTELHPLIDQARQARTRAKEKGGSQVFLTFA